MKWSPGVPRIVAAPLPWHVLCGPSVAFFGVLGLMSGVLIAWKIGTKDSWLIGIGFGLLLAAIVAGLGLAHHRSLARRRWIRTEASVPDEWAFVPELRRLIAALIDSVGFRLRARDHQGLWTDFCDVCNCFHIARPHTVVDPSLATRLQQIERPDHSMEPEPILGSGDTAGFRIWILPLFLSFVGFLIVSDGDVVAGSMLLGMAAFLILTSHPGLRDRFRILRWDEGRIVAGMGSFRDAQGRTFTTDDAVMVVQTRAVGGGLFVHFFGVHGATQITFTDEHDPDFVKLWQRWNHPHPRPDLPLE